MKRLPPLLAIFGLLVACTTKGASHPAQREGAVSTPGRAAASQPEPNPHQASSSVVSAPARHTENLGRQSAKSEVRLKPSGEPKNAPNVPLPTPTIGVNGHTWGSEMAKRVEARVRAVGGEVVLLSPDNADMPLDGLVLVGGRDIAPHRYDEKAHPTVRLVPKAREQFDFALIERALKNGLPVLGICLGAQQLWVARGGSMVQDIPSEVGRAVDHRAKERGHNVELTQGSRLAELYGGSLSVYSNHHQAPEGTARGFVVTAVSADGVLEAFESKPGTPFIVGVGWHPEHSETGTALFEALVHAAAKRAADSASRKAAK